MAFYDHFHASETSSITPVGRALLEKKNQHFLDLVKRFCPGERPTLLEIGPGQGFFAEQCRKNGVGYMAVEGNEKMADVLSKRGFEVALASVPPLALGRYFDVIFMDQVFEHMKGRDQALEMVGACRAHLNAGGVLFISSPDIFTWKEDFYSDYTHNLPTCMPMLQRIMLDCDLEVVHQEHIVSFVRGLLLTRLLSYIVRSLYAVGLFNVLFGKRAHLAKVSLLPSCVIVARAR
jgi:Methyltransferase domain